MTDRVEKSTVPAFPGPTELPGMAPSAPTLGKPQANLDKLVALEGRWGFTLDRSGAMEEMD